MSCDVGSTLPVAENAAQSVSEAALKWCINNRDNVWHLKVNNKSNEGLQGFGYTPSKKHESLEIEA